MLHGQDERAEATKIPVKRAPRAAASTAQIRAGVTIAANDPVDHKGELKAIGGSTSDAFNSTLANSVINALWVKNSDAAEKQRQLTAAACALVGIAPQDELEGMLAAQLIAANAAAMECYRRAMLGEQTFEGRKESLTQANKLSRTYATLLIDSLPDASPRGSLASLRGRRRAAA